MKDVSQDVHAFLNSSIPMIFLILVGGLLFLVGACLASKSKFSPWLYGFVFPLIPIFILIDMLFFYKEQKLQTLMMILGCVMVIVGLFVNSW